MKIETGEGGGDRRGGRYRIKIGEIMFCKFNMLFPEKSENILHKYAISGKLLIPGILISRYVYNFESDYRNVTGNFPPIARENNKNILERNNCIKFAVDTLNILNFGFNSYVSLSMMISENSKIKNSLTFRGANIVSHVYVVYELINYTFKL